MHETLSVNPSEQWPTMPNKVSETKSKKGYKRGEKKWRQQQKPSNTAIWFSTPRGAWAQLPDVSHPTHPTPTPKEKKRMNGKLHLF